MTAATSFKVIIGLDVGKTGHHACALSADGSRRYFDKPLPQDESKLRDLFTSLQAHGPVLLVVDQPNTIGALPVAVARDCSVAVAYLPGLAMRKAAALHPGTAKTDKRDAFIIAETARTIPATLRKGRPQRRSALYPQSARRVRRGHHPRLFAHHQPATQRPAPDPPSLRTCLRGRDDHP